MNKEIRRGNIMWIDLGQPLGSEQGGVRPCLIVQNDIGNKFSPCIIVVPLSNSIMRSIIPTQVLIKINENWSIILGEQIKTVDKRRIKNDSIIEHIEDMSMVEQALRISLAL